MTEGMPQVLLEAFAARLPVVATAVGGVPEMAGGRGLLIAPARRPRGRHGVAAAARRPGRARAVTSRRAWPTCVEHTLQAESARLARFLEGDA